MPNPNLENLTAEELRLAEEQKRERNWKRWGPYLSERQWGTVREDYSANGDVWRSFPHDHARSRAYRWGEDGLLGFCDRQCRLCFAVALWNGRDPILKERLYGLAGPEGNHGEDVKEEYFYLDSTPTHSYSRALYKYPQAAFPYDHLLSENRARGFTQPEYELADTGIFAENRYFDVSVEYAKASPEDILIRLRAVNRGPEAATLHLLPTFWFRNTWSWGQTGEGYWKKPLLSRVGDSTLLCAHESLGEYRVDIEPANGVAPELLFTDNETNTHRLYGTANDHRYVKDAFHDYLIGGQREAVSPAQTGTKAAAHYVLELPAGQDAVLRLRLRAHQESSHEPFGAEFDQTMLSRIREADEFYARKTPENLSPEETRVVRQAYAGLLWTKQFYYYDVRTWLSGDPTQPPPPDSRKEGRNAGWNFLFNRDIISVPDKWEYPWYAAWDLAFHMIPMASVDPLFAKQQLILFLREWYTHPTGEIPAYEFNFDNANPPVHAWACWRVYKMSGPRGQRDRLFLDRVFHKLLINFTWWVNRKDPKELNIFSGGFLGLDNIGVFDRSHPLPTGGILEQADSTAWMAFYCSTMLAMALELAEDDPAYEDIASKFFEHFLAIADAMNHLGGSGLWDEEDGFYYDQIRLHGQSTPLRVRSIVGLIPLFAVEVLESPVIDRLPGFKKRMLWFLENRTDITHSITVLHESGREPHSRRILAIPTRERLVRVLRRLLDENEFLSPYGVRSLSRYHKYRPYIFSGDHDENRVTYVPGDSDSALFGGNSNWRGPIWYPLNYLLIEALERYHHFYGDALKVEFPTGSGNMMTLREVARELASRLASLFLPDKTGARPSHGTDLRFRDDPHWKDLLLFHECFNGDTGAGVGASHQTGWTALVAKLMEDLARDRLYKESLT